jgi:hypothetical protein
MLNNVSLWGYGIGSDDIGISQLDRFTDGY